MKILRAASLGSYFTGSNKKECISVTETSRYFCEGFRAYEQTSVSKMAVLNP